MHNIFASKAPAKAKVMMRGQTACLVVTFFAGSVPLVWQFDLEKNPDCVVSLREKEGEWELGYTRPLGAFVPVARFDDRDDAEQSYDIIRDALGRLPVARIGWFWRFLLILVAVVLVAGFVQSLFDQRDDQRAPQVSGDAGMISPNQQPGSFGADFGVPLDADSVLKGQ